MFDELNYRCSIFENGKREKIENIKALGIHHSFKHTRTHAHIYRMNRRITTANQAFILMFLFYFQLDLNVGE